ncbi:serine hydrolase domain-containing protein [Parapedobacter koreensis]|uniref:CubicO group peptidase, beta-lactamase class C family n=1 Tax=Parapedobacter koreensis TaxID=332977 RepID=A0A1H7IVL0_9SPHI|nr:serine hydrolase [Parapedobacter koreensis]SEK66436.1 CubicO group peptidase, beta-lactamase class C family [Parapedobacter koreensis]
MMKTRYFLIPLLLATATLSGCKLGRFVWFNFAGIGDYKIFPARELHGASDPFLFHTAVEEKGPKTIDLGSGAVAFDDFLQQTESVAFLVIRNDSILYERYFDDYDQASIVPSFSMAKSVLSMLIGCAIEDGLIGAVQDPVSRYVPEMAKNGFDKVTIEHLLQMTSGLQFNEGYSNPFGEVATFYYGRRLRKATTKLKLETEPGTRFAYASGNSQVLGLVLDRALGDKTITQYLDEKIWQPIGMEYDATWSIDRKKEGLEKTFCCLNARARDFAKLGRLYLHHGNWEGKQLVPADWVRQSTKVDSTAGSNKRYQYQWWLPTFQGDFLAQGILGQYIYVNPAKNLIIVRLGHKVKANWFNVFINLAKGY